MATFTNTFKTGYRIKMVATESNVNVTNNTSDVTVKTYIETDYTLNSSATKNGSVVINGTTTNFTFVLGSMNDESVLVNTTTKTITHTADGSKSISISADCDINLTLGGTYYGTVSVSGTFTLSTIPRASTISLSTTSVTFGTTNLVVTIDRASTSFTHYVIYNWGTRSWTASTTATTSHSWSPTLSDCNGFPSSTSGTGTVTVKTYNGSTYIGERSATFTMTVPSSVVPTITFPTLTRVDGTVPPAWATYVKGKSKVSWNISGSGAYGSSISSYSISGDGTSWATATGTSNVLANIGSVIFTAKVTDTRGRTATATQTITVYDYTPPTIATASAYRSIADGTANNDGTYIRAICDATYASVNSKNTVAITYATKLATATTYGTAVSMSDNVAVIISGFSTSSSYDIKFTVTDAFTSITKTISIPTSAVLLDFKANGRGVGIGKVSELDDYLEVSYSSLFKSLVNASAGLLCTGGTFDSVTLQGTGLLKYNSGSVTNNAIVFSPYDSSGSYMGIGAGGLTIVGGGESTAASHDGLIAGGWSNGTEQLVLTSDNHVYVHSNLQNGYASRWQWAFNNGGDLVCPIDGSLLADFIGKTSSDHTGVQLINHVLPTTNGTHDLGTSTYKMRTLYATTTTINSDQREKENILDITDVNNYVSFLKAMRFVKYDYINHDPDGIEKQNLKNVMGFIAQEALAIDPVIADHFIDIGEDENKMLGVNTYAFASMVGLVVQEQQNKIEQLEQRLLALEARFQ